MAAIDQRIAEILTGVREMLERKQAGLPDQEEAPEFPYFLPDGSDVETVGQVAAMLGVSKAVAAYYVLEEKCLPDRLYAEAKSLLPAPVSDTSGVAIMLYPSRNDAEQIAYGGDGGNDWSQLHITLGYFGKVSEAPSEETLKEAAAHIASLFGPITVVLNGVTRFTGPDGENDPLVINCDSPELEEMRAAFLAYCEDREIEIVLNHGYSPHMTLGYLEPDQQTPITRWLTRTITVDDIGVGYGDKYTHYLLGSETSWTKDIHTGSVPGQATAGMTARPIVARARTLRRRKRKRPGNL